MFLLKGLLNVSQKKKEENKVELSLRERRIYLVLRSALLRRDDKMCSA